uniref:CD80-like immunoglobulin C2-set domain-containing protein n=1 Tax=Timema douglasi TaxID=61478 RepID=A0A7R8ZDQ1_TIMDO|nr:unnamed protein product [Timema douglasi]
MRTTVFFVALPDEGPRISGGRPRYQVGDMVRVNCTSGRSKPAAQLVWFINGQQADSSFLRGPDILQNGREDLETSVLGLEFRVMPKHFKRGDMKLKCLATIATVYWRSNEESVEGDRPQRTPVLESRETVPPSQSRADRVQGQYSGGVMRRAGREKVQEYFIKGSRASLICNKPYRSKNYISSSLNWTTSQDPEGLCNQVVGE